MKFRLIALVFLISLSSSVVGQTRYVEDRLEITMRNGQSTRNAILRMLKSGTAVDVLEVNDETGYTKVRVGEAEGWVLTRFLMSEPSGRQQLAETSQRLDRLRSQFSNSSEAGAALEQENSELRTEKSRLETESQRLARELEDIQGKAANVLAIDRENKQLKSDLAKTKSQLEYVTDENEALSDRNWQNGFILGAAVLLTGFLLGVIIPRIRFKKRSKWDL